MQKIVNRCLCVLKKKKAERGLKSQNEADMSFASKTSER